MNETAAQHHDTESLESHGEPGIQPPQPEHPPEPSEQEQPLTNVETEPRPSLAAWERLVYTNPQKAMELIPSIFPPENREYVILLVKKSAEGATDFTTLPTGQLFRDRLWDAFGNTGRAPNDTQVEEAKPMVAGAEPLSGVLPTDASLPLHSLDTLQERRGAPVLDEEGRFIGSPSMVMGFIDLAKFKHLNDEWGHAAGDVGLKTIGKKLSSLLRALEHGYGPAHLVMHRSGDEFGFCIPGVTKEEGAAIVLRLADALAPVIMHLENPGLGQPQADTQEVQQEKQRIRVELLGCIAGAFAPKVETYEEAMALFFRADDALNEQKKEERAESPRSLRLTA
jgi:diguanylate cyclase (GGDEF)-like protein